MNAEQPKRTPEHIIGSGLLSPKAIDLMQPYVDQHVAMVASISKLTDDELEALRAAAAEHDEINCWFRAYDAAGIVRSIIRAEASNRRLFALKDATHE